MPELTPAEQNFFETGDLSPELINVDPPEISEPAPQPALGQPVQQEISPAAPDAAEMLRRSLMEEQGRRIALEQRLAQLEAQRLLSPEPVPDKTTDPLGNMMHNLESLQASIQGLTAQQQMQQTAQYQQAQLAQFAHSMQQIRADFEKTVPDFQDAYKHLRDVHANDMREMGVPEPQISMQLTQAEIALAAAALQQGKNPAAMVYNMAKRYGYAPKAAPVSPAAKLSNLAKGAPAAFMPAKAAATDTPLTFENLKDASNSDLNALVKDDNAWAKFVGGGSRDIF